MYINQGSTEYHHLNIKWIDDYSNEINRDYVRMRCIGKNIYRSTKGKSGYVISGYNVLVYVHGRLKDYVLNELTIGDDILVVGRSIDRKPNTYTRQRCLLAECIYREDWLKYYPNALNINPKDYEDIYEENITDNDE